jgi:hypothetical protein
MNRISDEATTSTIPTPAESGDSTLSRRKALRKFGRYAAVTAPAVTLLMAANSKRALAASGQQSSRQFKNAEGVADGTNLSLLLANAGNGGGLSAIDGVGLCLAAIKALNDRLDGVEGALRPSLL